MDYNSGDFYWEAGDYIYVKDDDGTWQKSANAPTSKVAAFKYKVSGKFTASTSYKVYYLGKNSSGNDVTISSTQTQTAPDNTKHFGTYRTLRHSRRLWYSNCKQDNRQKSV